MLDNSTKAFTSLRIMSGSVKIWYRLGWWYWHNESLVLEQVRLVGVVADQILQGIELTTADVEVAANRSYAGKHYY